MSPYVGRPRQRRKAWVTRDPIEVILQSRRPTKAMIDRAYRKLNTNANGATYQSEVDHVKERNEQLYSRLLSTKWATLAEKHHRRVSETARKRSDKLRETGSKVKVGAEGGVPGVGHARMSAEKQTTKEPPPE